MVAAPAVLSSRNAVTPPLLMMMMMMMSAIRALPALDWLAKVRPEACGTAPPLVLRKRGATEELSTMPVPSKTTSVLTVVDVGLKVKLTTVALAE
jgi:hypothetical protein